MIWSDFEFVIHLACIIKPRILDIIWPCLLIIMIMTWLFSGILFICALVVSFALRARAANDTTRAQINNIPEKSHVIPLLNQRKNNCTFGQSKTTNILSISSNGQPLTPIENLLHTLTISGVFETYDNVICIETHNQLHLHTIGYSK